MIKEPVQSFLLPSEFLTNHLTCEDWSSTTWGNEEMHKTYLGACDS